MNEVTYETDVEPTTDDVRCFAVAVREMLDAQERASMPGALVELRRRARAHEEHVKQWVRGLITELNTPERRAA